MAVSVTAARPTKSPPCPRLPATVAATCGAVVSSGAVEATVRVIEPGSETFPATSVARYATVCSPGSATTTGPVVGRQPPSST